MWCWWECRYEYLELGGSGRLAIRRAALISFFCSTTMADPSSSNNDPNTEAPKKPEEPSSWPSFDFSQLQLPNLPDVSKVELQDNWQEQAQDGTCFLDGLMDP